MGVPRKNAYTWPALLSPAVLGHKALLHVCAFKKLYVYI